MDKKIKKTICLSSPNIGREEIQLVDKVLLSGRLERGEVTKILEERVRRTFKVKQAVVTANATGGLIAGLRACGVGDGDEVITTPFTFAATVNSIILCNAKPVYVDIDKNTFNLNPNLIEERISRKTKAILVVDLYGQTAAYVKIRKIAKKYRLFIIADSAQAIGTKLHEKYISSYVDLQVFSFYGSKSFTSGEGGLVVTDSAQLADKINLYITHGQPRGKKYEYKEIGWNFRPSDIQSAIIHVQLSKLNSVNKKRIENANYLSKALSNVEGIIVPKIATRATHVFSRYTIRVTPKFPLSRGGLCDYLAKRGIETETVYPKPLHFYPHLSFGFKKGSLPEAEKATREVLSVPIHQNLATSDLKYIAYSIREASRKRPLSI